MPRALVVLLLAVPVLLASCGSGSTSIGAAPAATVNGVDVPASEVEDQLDAVAEVAEYGGAFGLQGGVTGSTPGTYDTTAAAQVLNTLITLTLVEEEVADRGLEVTDADRASADEQVTALLGSTGSLGQTDPEFGAEQAGRVPSAALERFVDGLAAYQVLQTDLASDVAVEDVTDEDVRRFYDENPDAVAGAPFEEVAEQIRAALEEQAVQEARQAAVEPFDEWLGRAVLDADVTVDPRFGRWAFVVPSGGGIEEVEERDEAEAALVLPPEGPEAASTTTAPVAEQLVPPPG